MASVQDALERCEASLSEQLAYFAEDDGDNSDKRTALPPHAHALATLKACTEVLSNASPVPRVTEGIAASCAELLEYCGTSDGVLLRILTQFLADMSLEEDNGSLFCRFGLPSSYLLILQRWQTLTADTLNCIFDFLSTLSINSAVNRQSIRPCIPYVLAVMEHNLYSMEVLFGAAVTLSTLATLDDKNCEVIAQRGGVQLLIAAFYHAFRTQSTVAKVEQKKGLQSSSVLLARTQTRRLDEKARLCEDVQKWCRDVLLKVCRSRCEAATAALQQADFGAYGHCLALDELKWTLLLDEAASGPAGRRPSATVAS